MAWLDGEGPVGGYISLYIPTTSIVVKPISQLSPISMDPGSSAAGGSFELLARNQRFTPLQSSRSSNLGNSHSNHNDASEQWDTDTEASPLLGKGKKPVGRQGTGGASPPIGKVEEPGGSQRRSHIEPISVPPPELPTGPGLVDERGNTLPLEGAANVPEILEGAVQPEGNIVTYKEYRLKERPAENTDPDTVKVDRSKGVIIDLGYVYTRDSSLALFLSRLIQLDMSFSFDTRVTLQKKLTWTTLKVCHFS